MRRSINQRFGVLALAAALICVCWAPASATSILNFSDVPSGTLTIFGPYTSQGFTLTSSSGGFAFNSPGTGNGSPQSPGTNPFYAGANGLAAFAPATITLMDTGGDPFSLLSIGLARDFAFDPAPTVTFIGTLDGGGTVSETFMVSLASPPLTFQTFSFAGFTNVVSVSWNQPTASNGLHQFGNVELASAASPAAVPEPATLSLLLMALPAVVGRARRGSISAQRLTVNASGTERR